MSRFAHPIDDDLALLPPLPRHAPAFYAATEASRERIGRWLNWVDTTRAEGDSRAFLVQGCRELGRRKSLSMPIEHRGQIAGCVGLNWINPRNRTAEIGYWLAEGHEGHGVMTRCVRALLDHAHGPLRLERVQICASVENQRSRAVIERLGLPLEAIVHAGDPLPDERVTDQAVYASIAGQRQSSVRPIEFVLETSRPEVKVALEVPHHAGAIFEIVERERARLDPWVTFPRRCRTRSQARKLVRRAWEGHADDSSLITTILVDGEVAGGIGVTGLGGPPRRGELGYWLSERFEGRGVMSAAMHAFISHLWHARPDLVRLQLRTLVHNERSRRLAEACGFRGEGTLRSVHRSDGKSHDAILYGMTREDTLG